MNGLLFAGCYTGVAVEAPGLVLDRLLLGSGRYRASMWWPTSNRKVTREPYTCAPFAVRGRHDAPKHAPCRSPLASEIVAVWRVAVSRRARFDIIQTFRPPCALVRPSTGRKGGLGSAEITAQRRDFRASRSPDTPKRTPGCRSVAPRLPVGRSAAPACLRSHRRDFQPPWRRVRHSTGRKGDAPLTLAGKSKDQKARTRRASVIRFVVAG